MAPPVPDDKTLIQSLWIGSELSMMEQLSIMSFLRTGHEYHLYAYDSVKDVPAGVALKNASEILSADRIFKYKEHDSYSAFSNLFRYKLLLEKGGYWADTDVVCLRHFDHPGDHLFAEEQVALHEKRICGNIIKAPRDSKIIQFCYESSLEKNPNELRWGEIGPELLSVAVAKFQSMSDVQPYKTFNPVNWWEWEQLIQDQVKTRLKFRLRMTRSYAIHLWNEMWRRNNMDKNRTYPANCLYEQLKRKYL